MGGGGHLRHILSAQEGHSLRELGTRRGAQRLSLRWRKRRRRRVEVEGKRGGKVGGRRKRRSPRVLCFERGCCIVSEALPRRLKSAG